MSFDDFPFATLFLSVFIQFDLILYEHLWKNAPLTRNIEIIDLQSIYGISGRCTPAPASFVETPRIDRHGDICGPEPALRLAGGRHFAQSCDLLTQQNDTLSSPGSHVI